MENKDKSTTNKERNVSIDLLKTFALTLMVFDHVGFGEEIHTYIQSFHMPLFFIISGYLWKERSIIVDIKKKAKSLLIPYFLFGFLYTLIKAILNYGETTRENIRSILFFPTDLSNMPYNPALWYLYCAFIANVLFSVIMHIQKQKIAYSIIVLISVMGVTFSTISNTMLPFAIEPVCVAMLFMLIGHILCKTQCHRNRSVFGGIALVILEWLLAFINIGSVDMRSARYHNPILYIVNGILGTLGWWIIFEKNKVKAISKYASFIAQNGIVFICLNQFIIRYISKIAAMYNLHKIIVFVATWIICIFVGAVSDKTCLKKMFGK